MPDSSKQTIWSIGRSLPSANVWVASRRHVRRYLKLVLCSCGIGADPPLHEHIGISALDLIAVTLGAGREAAELARMRGLSTRQVQHQLHETGASFTARGLERRRQQARASLSDPRHPSRSIIDIAACCGFNDVSYVDRRFCSQFGAAPTDVRAPVQPRGTWTVLELVPAERDFTDIRVLAAPLAELATPPAMRDHAEWAVTMIARLPLSHHALAQQSTGTSLR